MVEPHLQIIMQSGGTAVGVSAAGSLDDSVDVCVCVHADVFIFRLGQPLAASHRSHSLLALSVLGLRR